MANEASRLHGIGMNLEAIAKRIQYLTSRGYISPENKEELNSLFHSLKVHAEGLEYFSGE